MKASKFIDSRNAVFQVIGNSRSKRIGGVGDYVACKESARRSEPMDYAALTSAAIQKPRPPHAIYARRWRRFALALCGRYLVRLW